MSEEFTEYRCREKKWLTHSATSDIRPAQFNRSCFRRNLREIKFSRQVGSSSPKANCRKDLVFFYGLYSDGRSNRPAEAIGYLVEAKPCVARKSGVSWKAVVVLGTNRANTANTDCNSYQLMGRAEPNRFRTGASQRDGEINRLIVKLRHRMPVQNVLRSFASLWGFCNLKPFRKGQFKKEHIVSSEQSERRHMSEANGAQA